MGLFDDVDLTFDCPECGEEINKLISEIKREPEFSCPSCGGLIDANDLVSELEDADDAWEEFRDGLDDIDGFV